MYSRVQRIDFAYLSEAEDPNTPYPSIDNRNFVRNVIGLAYDYENRRLFYSDIQLGNIMAAEFRTANKSHQVYEVAASKSLGVSRFPIASRRIFFVSFQIKDR